MSLMVDPLCQSRHQVSQVRKPKGIAVCDEKPAHLEQWPAMPVEARANALPHSLLEHTILSRLPPVYQNKSMIAE
jgi:hypothetical protein